MGDRATGVTDQKAGGAGARGLERWAILAISAAVFASAAFISQIARARRRQACGRHRGAGRRGDRGRRRPRCVLATGTFFHRNWLVSHATPLARSGFGRVVFVVDGPQEPIEGVEFVYPPKWLVRVGGRAVGKLWCMIGAGFRYRPDVFMGYYIFPSGVLALVVGRLFGARCCYQMTGGPVELIGGGAETENRFMGRLRRGSPMLERLAERMVREFDLVVVRGRSARAYVEGLGIRGRVAIVPGSLEPGRFAMAREREIDLVFVGRLAEVKQPVRFVEIAAGVRDRIGSVRAVMVGDGPLRDAVMRRAAELDVANSIEMLGKTEAVADVLGRAKVFVMTSISEGLSIAMAEAMAAGAVPIVSDVGELGDLVIDAETGYLVQMDDVARFADLAAGVLRDESLRERLSSAARDRAVGYNGVDVVAQQWRQNLDGVVDRC